MQGTRYNGWPSNHLTLAVAHNNIRVAPSVDEPPGAPAQRTTDTLLMTKLIVSGLAVLLLAVAGCSSLPQRDDATRDWDVQRFYTEGQDALRAENYQQAVDYFKVMQRRFPDDERTAASRLEIAYAWYKLGDTDEAVASAERYIALPGNPAHVDYAWYLKGLALYQDAMRPSEEGAKRREARLRDAFREFSTLTRNQPNSKYTEDALQRMVDIRNRLGDLELEKARADFENGKAEAATKRATHIVDHYENSPAAPQAYALMIDAYKALGQQQAANDARAALEQKYPDFRYTPAVTSAPEASIAAPVTTEKPQPPAPAGAAAPVNGNDEQPERVGTPARSAPASPKPAAAMTDTRTEEWLLAQPANRYALQILGTGDKAALMAFIARHQLQDKAAYFTSKTATGEWYSLVYGDYATPGEAQRASAELPAPLQRSNPWIRRNSEIHAAINKDRAASTTAPGAAAQPPLPQPSPAGAIH